MRHCVVRRSSAGRNSRIANEPRERAHQGAGGRGAQAGARAVQRREEQEMSQPIDSAPLTISTERSGACCSRLNTLPGAARSPAP